nr:Gfo/Idh/MocA family oxidoreductase [uncultured Campylobacter sp.]
MRVLVVGYGSIGSRHCEVLSSLGHEVEVLTSKDLKEFKSYKSFDEISPSEFDYFVIATPTNKHFENLEFLNKNVKNKIIFCEKPLFESKKAYLKLENSVFVGYVLRYHPLLLKLKNELKNEKIIFAQAKCSSYLPTWRKGDYRKCYSASKDRGGGVLLDLSHEIDYLLWLLGDFELSFSVDKKISDLQITSNDFCAFFAKGKSGEIISVNLDYISKITQRTLLIETLDKSFLLDFIASKLKIADKNGEILEFLANLDRNSSFKAMHEDILGKKEFACDYEFALKTMEIINEVQKENK